MSTGTVLSDTARVSERTVPVDTFGIMKVMNDTTVNVDDVVRMLDEMTKSDVSRIKVLTDENAAEGEPVKKHHHGRCDIGSPWACGEAFDVLE